MTYTKLHLYTEGGSRGNPGPSAIGIVIRDSKGRLIREHGEFIGHKTNNQADYTALMKGLALCVKYNPSKVRCISNNQLVVNQMNGSSQVKNAGIKDLYDKANKKAKHFHEVAFEHVSKTHKNIIHADRLVNVALDRASRNTRTRMMHNASASEAEEKRFFGRVKAKVKEIIASMEKGQMKTSHKLGNRRLSNGRKIEIWLRGSVVSSD